MYAIVRISGRQYKAEPGRFIITDKLPYEEGEVVTLDDVLLVANDDEATIGTPNVEGAVVSGKVLEQFKDKKVVVFKYKSKNRYRRKAGHRQPYTKLLIEDISVGKKAKKSSKKAEEPAEEVSEAEE